MYYVVLTIFVLLYLFFYIVHFYIGNIMTDTSHK